MRVLVVPKWYPWPERPVFGIFCQEQARALSSRHDVVVLASEATRAPGFLLYRLTEGQEDGLCVLRLRYRRPRLRPLAMACQIAGMLAALRRLRRQGWRPDVVHAHVYSAGLPALILGRLNRATVVITEHYTGFQRGLITGSDRVVARLAFRHADLVAPVSQSLASELRALEPRARMRVVPNVVDEQAFHPAPPADASKPATPRSAQRLLNVAALAEKKGHGDLLHALRALTPELDLRLEVVGDGPLMDELRALTAELGLEAAVSFRGELPKAAVADRMREADLFVLPSLFENLPCVLLEAMASGLPFVASAVGGVPELADGPGTTLCPPGDPARLAEAIRSALASRPAVDRQALAQRTVSRFGYGAFTRVWTEIYEELVSSRRRERWGLSRGSADGDGDGAARR